MTETTATKKAVELVPGDRLTGQGGAFPPSLYAGVVASTTVVDAGVQINLAEGGFFVRPEDELLQVVVDVPEDAAS